MVLHFFGRPIFRHRAQQDVSGTLDVTDLHLVDLATGLMIDPASIAVTFDVASNTAAKENALPQHSSRRAQVASRM